MKYRGSISSRFSSNSEADASELLEHLEEMFLRSTCAKKKYEHFRYNFEYSDTLSTLILLLSRKGLTQVKRIANYSVVKEATYTHRYASRNEETIL